MFKLKVEAKELNDFGYAVVRVKERNFQIRNMLPGETAEVTFFDNGTGKVDRLIDKSPLRQKPKCPWYSVCGGCQLQHFAYEEQLEIKQKRLVSLFQKSGFDIKVILPIIGMKEPFNYRNKAQMVISEKGKKIMAGLYEENTHNIVNVDYCSIQSEKANEIVKTCRRLLQEQNIKPYDETRKTGLIRHIYVRTATVTGQILVAIVTASERFPGRNNFVKALRAAHPEITTIIQNINSRQTPIVLGEFERVLYGIGHIEDELLGKKHLVSAKTFYQVNHRQTEILYQKILEFSKPKQDDVVIDLFAGIGTIGMVFADKAAQVTCVEANKASVHNGTLNAKLNHLRNIRFRALDVLEYLESFQADEHSVDIVIVDPPREGLKEQIVKVITNIKPKKIVYVSCNPETLMVDLQGLVQNGYTIERVQSIDMFPHTYHVETVVLMSRVDK